MRRTGSVLVIDDEEIMREILEALLTREGYHVRLASSGAEGLELAKSLPFDAVIVDVMMPGIDGITTLNELKKIDDDLPVLMITASNGTDFASSTPSDPADATRTEYPSRDSSASRISRMISSSSMMRRDPLRAMVCSYRVTAPREPAVRRARMEISA